MLSDSILNECIMLNKNFKAKNFQVAIRGRNFLNSDKEDVVFFLLEKNMFEINNAILQKLVCGHSITDSAQNTNNSFWLVIRTTYDFNSCVNSFFEKKFNYKMNVSKEIKYIITIKTLIRAYELLFYTCVYCFNNVDAFKKCLFKACTSVYQIRNRKKCIYFRFVYFFEKQNSTYLIRNDLYKNDINEKRRVMFENFYVYLKELIEKSFFIFDFGIWALKRYNLQNYIYPSNQYCDFYVLKTDFSLYNFWYSVLTKIKTTFNIEFKYKIYHVTLFLHNISSKNFSICVSLDDMLEFLAFIDEREINFFSIDDYRTSYFEFSFLYIKIFGIIH